MNQVRINGKFYTGWDTPEKAGWIGRILRITQMNAFNGAGILQSKLANLVQCKVDDDLFKEGLAFLVEQGMIELDGGYKRDGVYVRCTPVGADIAVNLRLDRQVQGKTTIAGKPEEDTL